LNISLTDSQKKTVSEWVSQGNPLAEVQRLLQKEFSISMTYMDVRFLVDDLNVAPKEEPSDEADETEEKVEEPEIIDEGLSKGVSIEVDAVTPPGALMSGRVTFGDGVNLGWQLLSNGQLGLIPDDDNTDYRPSPEDMQEFRVQMDGILRKKGFGI
jgi:hypothetical protein